MSDQISPKTGRKRRHLRRIGKWSVLSTVFVTALLAAGVYYMLGKPIYAPKWVQDRIEARINENLPDALIRFGELVFVLDQDGHPRVRLSDVVVETSSGVEVVAFQEARISLSLQGLLKRTVQPREIFLDGVVAALVRDEKGKVSLSAGFGAAPSTREAATVPELIGQMDRLFEQPALKNLRDAELTNLTLTYADLRTGRSWAIDQSRLRLNREGDRLTLSAILRLLGDNDKVTTAEANYTGRIGENTAEFGMSFDNIAASDIAAQSPAFAWLDVLRAPISGSARSGLDAEGKFRPINASLQIGAGAVQPNPEAQPIPFDGARAYFRFDPAEGVLEFDELSVQSKWVSGRAEGNAVLGGIQDGKLTDLVGQLEFRDLVANPAGLYDAPVSLSEADIDFRVKLDPFKVTLGRLQIVDNDQTLQVDGELSSDDDGWHVAVDGRMDGIAPDRLLTLWPERLKPKTRKWIVDNLHDGRASNIDIAFRRQPDAKPDLYLAFDFEDVEVRFLKTFPHAKGGRGHGVLADNRFVVNIDGGTVLAPQGGAVTLESSAFIMPDVRVKPAPLGVVRLKTRSTVTAMLSMLNLPPINAMDKARLPVTLADGQALLEGTLDFPIRKGGKPEDVNFVATGKLLNVRSDTLVKDRALRAPEMSFEASNKNLTLTGAGQLDDVRFDATWLQPIGKGSSQSNLRANVAFTPDALAAFNIALPPGMISGSGTGALTVDLERGQPPKFALSSDLRGLRVAVPQISWVKPAAGAGRLQVSGRLGTPPQVDVLQVEGAGLRAAGSVQLNGSGGLERVRFDRLAMDNWLDIPVDLIGRGKGQSVQVVVRGGRIDLRNARFGKGRPPTGPVPPMLLALDRLQITDQIALTGMTGRFDLNSGLDGAFNAQINGSTPVQGRVVPQNGRSAVQLTSQNAGGVLRAAEIVRQVDGGSMSLTLLPVGSGGAFDGRLQLKGVTIRDAPSIAALVNAISVVGLVNELNGDGIYFDDVEADFRLSPNRVTLTSASAVGNSMGISMDGVFATDTGRISMQGVISPVYLLNSIGSILTRKGEGLIGFNYALRGTAQDPSVSVNPLSALTPGMFREIFRAPPPALPNVEGVSRSTLPAPPPDPAQNEVVRPGEDR